MLNIEGMCITRLFRDLQIILYGKKHYVYQYIYIYIYIYIYVLVMHDI